MSRQPRMMGLRQWASEVILEHMDVAAILLSADGRVVYTNPAAERMLGAGRSLSIYRNRLKTADADRQYELNAIVARAGLPGGEAERRAGMVRVEDACGELFLRVIPVPYDKHSEGPQGGIVVLVHDCASFQGHAARQLRKQYGLTDTEIRLVCHLVEGCSVREAAARMRVAYETARSYLKSVFRKTDTHRQIELLQKIARTETARRYAQGDADRS